MAVAVGTSGMLATLVDPKAAVLYLAFAGVPAAAALWFLGRGWRIESVICMATGVALIGLTAAAWALRGDLAGTNASLAQAWSESFVRALDLYRHFGMSDEKLADLELQRATLQQTTLSLLPAIAVLSAGILWFVNLRLARRWIVWPQLFNLKEWKTPDWLIWMLIAAGFAAFVPHPGARWAAGNLLLIVLGCYFCQGLAIVSFYLQRLGLPAGLRGVVYLLVLVHYAVAGIVLMLGVFDLWADFRRLSVGAADAAGHVDSE